MSMNDQIMATIALKKYLYEFGFSEVQFTDLGMEGSCFVVRAVCNLGEALGKGSQKKAARQNACYKIWSNKNANRAFVGDNNNNNTVQETKILKRTVVEPIPECPVTRARDQPMFEAGPGEVQVLKDQVETLKMQIQRLNFQLSNKATTDAQNDSLREQLFQATRAAQVRQKEINDSKDDCVKEKNKNFGLECQIKQLLLENQQLKNALNNGRAMVQALSVKVKMQAEDKKDIREIVAILKDLRTSGENMETVD